MKEEYYIERDAFMAYIMDEVNPARKKAGLSEIREDEARECFRVLKQFDDKWNHRPEPIPFEEEFMDPDQICEDCLLKTECPVTNDRVLGCRVYYKTHGKPEE